MNVGLLDAAIASEPWQLYKRKLCSSGGLAAVACGGWLKIPDPKSDQLFALLSRSDQSDRSRCSRVEEWVKNVWITEVRSMLCMPMAIILLLPPFSCGGGSGAGSPPQSPQPELHAEGYVAGPFTLVLDHYEVLNSASKPIEVVVDATEPWLRWSGPSAFRIDRESSVKLPLSIDAKSAPTTPGLYRATLRISDSVSSSTTQSMVVSLAVSPRPAPVWTDPAPSASSRLIYVSSSLGDDGNSGLSPLQPKRTLPAAQNLLRDGYPDHLYLRRGDTWNDVFDPWRASGKSADEPLVVATYGNAPARPKIMNPGKRAIEMWRRPFRHVWFLGLDIESSGGGQAVSCLEPTEDLLFEDCRFARHPGNLVLQSVSPTVPHRDIRLRYCQILDASQDSAVGHSQGMYVDNVDGMLIEGCLFDHNGWHESLPGHHETIFNHNIYIQYTCRNIELVDSILARGSSHGAQLRPGGTVRGCVFASNAIALLLGSSGGGPAGGGSADVRNNVIVGGKNIAAQSRGWGLHLENIQVGEVVDNIIVNQKNGGDPRGIEISTQVLNGIGTVTFRGNLLREWAGVTVRGNRLHGALLFECNEFQLGGSAPLVAIEDVSLVSRLQFRRNRYQGSQGYNWFQLGGMMDFATWQQRVDDVGSRTGLVQYSLPDAGLGTYESKLSSNQSATLAEFLSRARLQSRATWNQAYTAGSVRAFFADAFGGH